MTGYREGWEDALQDEVGDSVFEAEAEATPMSMSMSASESSIIIPWSRADSVIIFSWIGSLDSKDEVSAVVEADSDLTEGLAGVKTKVTF